MVVGVMNFLSPASILAMKALLLQTVTVHGLTFAYWQLALAIGAAFAGFTLFMILGDILGREGSTIIAVIAAITAAVWLLYIALSAATGGVMAALGGKGALAAMGIMAGSIAAVGAMNVPSHQMGTRMIEATGPALVHRGEVIYNPSTNRPTQVGNDLMGGGKPSTTVFDMPITIQEMHTKSDFDDVDERLRQGMRKMSRNQKR
jgi:hypothetical protein